MQQTPAPEGPRGQTLVRRAAINSTRKTQINMKMLRKGSRLQPKAGSQKIATTAQQQDLIKGTISSGHGYTEHMGATHSYPVRHTRCTQQLHLLLLTHEMCELSTPLIAANKPSKEIEVRELPAQPPRYTGTTRSSFNIAS
ncbi:hypothetical protein F511_34620 [Dorcoceras hygrometricum]|uniref:Uncharacterized protein n=1 Tax=Dorcoceras hygrometricum TaxID=472368 RepID=A0A2Z7DE59_9LAMI|nr:hypothetical protein F511_34620 [Dorcoceras hygrometricum]